MWVSFHVQIEGAGESPDSGVTSPREGRASTGAGGAWGAASGRALLGWEVGDTCLGPSWPGLDQWSPLVGQVLHELAAHRLDHSTALGLSQC